MSTPRHSPTPERRTHYVAPAVITETSIAALLNGKRSIDRTPQQSLIGSPRGVSDRTLWIAGDPALLQLPVVAIVGTRQPSEPGARRARKLARELVRHGVVIVSGVATGIDDEALTEAIAAGGRVIGVIGTPIDRVYPVENAELQETIARDHLLVSPFATGTRTLPRHFPERNRVMAVLSDVTAIIEAADTSGTLHQARECVRLDRWLFLARNIVDNHELTWPATFRNYAKARTLSDTSDILSVLDL